MATAFAGAVRRGTLAAARLHQTLESREKIESSVGSVDVFEAFLQVNLPHLLRPLDGLLGAFINDPVPGVLITTQRPLSVQRFTAAHELGHFTLGHSPSLDDEGILRRSPFASSTGGGFHEVEANAFAAAFLMPRWLVDLHCRLQAWTVSDLQQPETLYQLSLRLGVSYTALYWTLTQYRMISADVAARANAIEPRQLKRALLRDHRPADYRGDVWRLTERDAGTRIEGSRSDIFVLELAENAGAGYLWNFDQLEASGFVILRSTSDSDDDESIGGPVTRRVTASVENAGRGELRLDERRPWMAEEVTTSLELKYDVTGPEPEGLSRAERRRLLVAA